MIPTLFTWEIQIRIADIMLYEYMMVWKCGLYWLLILLSSLLIQDLSMEFAFFSIANGKFLLFGVCIQFTQKTEKLIQVKTSVLLSFRNCFNKEKYSLCPNYSFGHKD